MNTKNTKPSIRRRVRALTYDILHPGAKRVRKAKAGWNRERTDIRKAHSAELDNLFADAETAIAEALATTPPITEDADVPTQEEVMAEAAACIEASDVVIAAAEAAVEPTVVEVVAEVVEEIVEEEIVEEVVEAPAPVVTPEPKTRKKRARGTKAKA